MTSPERSPDASSTTLTPEKGVSPDIKALDVKAFEDMREKQKQLVISALSDIDPYDREAKKTAKENVYATFDARAKAYLISEGVVMAEDDPKMDRALAYVRQFSIDKMSDDKWLYDEVDDHGVGVPSGRNTVHRDFQELKRAADTLPLAVEDDEPKPDEDPAEKARKEEAKAEERLEKIKKLEEELKGVQGAKHIAFAARMAVGFFRRGKRKELDAAYEEASKNYLEKLEELELLKMEKQDEELAESLVPHSEVINEDLQKRFDTLLKSDDDAQREAMLKAGGWKARQLERYANMSKKKKIALMLGAGAFLATVGAGLAIIGGAIGTGLAITGGAALGGTKGSKAYFTTLSRIYKKKDEAKLGFKLEDKSIDHKDALKLALARLKGESDEDIKDADKKKRNAVLIGMGAAALGSGVGTALAHGADWVSDRPIPGWGGGMVGDAIAGSEHVPAPGAPDLDHTWTVKPEVDNLLELNPEDYYLRDGAGLYEEFGKIPGIDKSHYHELWQKVGPELQQFDNGAGRPLVYEMHGEPGNWGIRMTADHQMPHEAMQLIKDRYDEMFGSGVGSDHVADALTDTTPDLTASDVQSLQNVIHMDTIAASDLPANVHLLDTLSFTAPNMPGTQFAINIGLPSRVWLDNLQPYIADQISNHNPNYINSFYLNGNNSVTYTGNGKLPPATIADMLTHIPKPVRESLTIS